MRNIGAQIVFLLLIVLAVACRKEEMFTNDSSAKLSFSSDNIVFDTVFTSIGSVTQWAKVYNYNENAVRISEIKLAGGAVSPFEININGVAANQSGNVEVRGNDSINIFIKVTINPTAAELPFIVKDSITFLTNGNRQAIRLQAHGQNAHILKGGIISQNTVWDNKMPYIVYNTVRVNNNSTLTIPGKSRIYFHKGSKLEIDGTLIIDGTVTDSVVLGSDRLERIYRDEPGQWLGLYFTGSSVNNKINHTVIKNAIVGIQSDSLPSTGSPKILLTNSTVKNMQVAGFVGYKTSLSAFNNLFFNCGQHLVYGAYGGDYNLKQNTFANYTNSFPRSTPSVFFTDAMPISLRTSALSLNITNNIIWGNVEEELVFDNKGTLVNSIFQNNLIRNKNLAFIGNGNILNADPQFINAQSDRFKLNSGSPAGNKGTNLSGDFYYNLYLRTDKAGRQRPFPSDLGCFEIQ